MTDMPRVTKALVERFNVRGESFMPPNTKVPPFLSIFSASAGARASPEKSKTTSKLE